MRTRKAIYWTDAARWVALNDDPEDTDVESIEMNTTVCMIADLSGQSVRVIAEEIAFIRTSSKQVQAMPIQSMGVGDE